MENIYVSTTKEEANELLRKVSFFQHSRRYALLVTKDWSVIIDNQEKNGNYLLFELSKEGLNVSMWGTKEGNNKNILIGLIEDCIDDAKYYDLMCVLTDKITDILGTFVYLAEDEEKKNPLATYAAIAILQKPYEEYKKIERLTDLYTLLGCNLNKLTDELNEKAKSTFGYKVKNFINTLFKREIFSTKTTTIARFTKDGESDAK